MPVSKRLKDALVAYQDLHIKYLNAHQEELAARRECFAVKISLQSKVNEVLKEMDSCVPRDSAVQECVVEVGGESYFITTSPSDHHSDLPSYIRKVRIERC